MISRILRQAALWGAVATFATACTSSPSGAVDPTAAATNTAAPPATNTSAPATNTAAPPPTNTSAPATNTAAPPATNTSAPATKTVAPSNTATHVPSIASPGGQTSTVGGGNFPPEISRGDPHKPLVALTFDSGSVPGQTSKVLDILSRNQVRASFFITGQFAEKNPALVRRVAQEGHEVWNHSYTHSDFTEMSNAAIIAEMDKTEGILKGLTGKTTKPLMRMPFGARNRQVWQAVGSAGYRSVYWTLDSADWRDGWTAPMVRDRVINGVENGFIVVHHSSPAATADSLEAIILALRAKGFQLVPVSVLIGQGGSEGFPMYPADEAANPNDPLVLVDKLIGLSADYEPEDLVSLDRDGIPALRRGLQIRGGTAPYLQQMLEASRDAGLDIQVLSSYRSYQDQQAIYSREVASVGKAQAERTIAPPGHSQHQLGTTVDFTARSVGWDLSEDFGSTREGRWLAANAADYGFVLSYPQGKEEVTGYAYEPWHFRYLGIEAARLLARQGVTMEEFLSKGPTLDLE